MKKLYWIDDSHDNQRLPQGAVKRQLEKSLGVTLEPDKPINNRSEFVELMSSMDPKVTIGVIMDYQLTDVAERKQMAFGTIYAAEIRAKFPAIPVIGISHCPEKDIPKFQLESFLAFFPRKQLTDTNPKIEDLRALLEGYNTTFNAFQKRSVVGLKLMLDLLDPPHDIRDLLSGAIPAPFRGGWDKETPHTAGRWIWHELQGRPGFLLDELGLATNLGLNLKGIQRISSKFDAARYRGVFASEGRPRWWLAPLRGIVENIIGDAIVGPVSYARNKLLAAARIKVSERSTFLARPHGRKGFDEVPDCVAYKDDEREENDRVQALFTDTRVDEREIAITFGFEPRRIYMSALSK